jgi:aminoglycoside/choline kinase family phosphotransferase
MPQRLELLSDWLSQVMAGSGVTITPASADASFRRYFRVILPGATVGSSLIAMDAPPDKEDTGPFVKISDILTKAGLHVPEVIEQNKEQGFLLLTDLGSQPYLEALNNHTVERLYADALAALLQMQCKAPREEGVLPPYDEALLLREMELFREWYLRRHRTLSLTASQQEMLDTVFRLLAESALAQPRVFVHRDYHSRNLMVTSENNPGILDFQDAVIGPVTYDLVSLLRDCYIQWPRDRVERWALDYLHRAAEAGVFEMTPDIDDEQLLRWFDWMGVQRHMKATGIFARLWLRDSKKGYLGDIPRTLGYVQEVSARYPELHGLYTLLEKLL